MRTSDKPLQGAAPYQCQHGKYREPHRESVGHGGQEQGCVFQQRQGNEGGQGKILQTTFEPHSDTLRPGQLHQRRKPPSQSHRQHIEEQYRGAHLHERSQNVTVGRPYRADDDQCDHEETQFAHLCFKCAGDLRALVA